MTGLTVEQAKQVLIGLNPSGERLGAVRIAFDGELARITIDHPEARSAVSLSMMVDLADAVLALRAWPGALALISSTDPRSFCAGGHLGQVTRAVGAGSPAIEMARAMTVILDGLMDAPQITVAAIDGIALGGGAELATAADFRVAGPEARLHFVHARLGIAPGWGGAGRLTRIVGRRAALSLLTRARSVGPGEAVEIGLVDHRCDGGAVDAAMIWLADLRALPPEVVRGLKRQVVAAAPARVGAEVEAEAFASLWGGPAHERGLAGLERHRR
ncbi:MAG: enoyl-CoA hydratase/isomerase family protein [Myxococcota bacterium]